jgi:hypothetical protein
MKKVTCLLVLSCATVCLWAQGQQQWDPRSTEWYSPVPPKVQPGEGVKPPSDAIILFDGNDLSQWETARGNGPAEWKVENGELIIVPGKGAIRTKGFFGDCQLHVEFKSPAPLKYNGQNRGNSGIMLHGGRYEIQVLDGDNNPTYVNGMVGSIYKQSAPLVNAYTENGKWQIYDIYWKAPVFADDGLKSPAMVTVVLNGIVVQNNYILNGTTTYTGLPKYTAHGRLPIELQDHGTETAFRNIWIRNL